MPNLDRIITPQRICIYIYIHIHVNRDLIGGQKFGNLPLDTAAAANVVQHASSRQFLESRGSSYHPCFATLEARACLSPVEAMKYMHTTHPIGLLTQCSSCSSAQCAAEKATSLQGRSATPRSARVQDIERLMSLPHLAGRINFMSCMTNESWLGIHCSLRIWSVPTPGGTRQSSTEFDSMLRKDCLGNSFSSNYSYTYTQ